MKWITRENVRVDRVACPWLIKGAGTCRRTGRSLRALAEGFAALGISDEERLNRQFPVYDALYAYASRQAG